MLPYVVTLFSISHHMIFRLGAKFKTLNIIVWILDAVFKCSSYHNERPPEEGKCKNCMENTRLAANGIGSFWDIHISVIIIILSAVYIV